MIFKTLAAGTALPALVAALPLLIITLAVLIVVLVSLLPSKALRAHACRLVKLLTHHAAVLKGGTQH